MGMAVHMHRRHSLSSCMVLAACNSIFAMQVSYMILQRVTPVTHSVGNCLKRVIVIVASVIVFQNPMSQKNMIGKLSLGCAVGLPLLCLFLDFCYNHHHCSNTIIVISVFMLYVYVMGASVQSASTCNACHGTICSCSKHVNWSCRHWHLLGWCFHLQSSQEDVWQEEGCSCMKHSSAVDLVDQLWCSII